MFSLFNAGKKSHMITKEDALPGRDTPLQVSNTHLVLGTPTTGDFAGYESITIGMGCFWGAERRFWKQQGVHSTQVGYAAGFTQNPSYQEVCSGKTGHNEVVRIHYKESEISLDALLKVFWESHDPTQVMRQGNDIGSQYRSGIYCSTEEQLKRATASKNAYEEELKAKGFNAIATEVEMASTFYYAEDYHQQYLKKNPGGYCGLKGTGVSCAI